MDFQFEHDQAGLSVEDSEEVLVHVHHQWLRGKMNCRLGVVLQVH